jgi:ATP-dependent helicase Lhr and Lhr-like helicase
VTADAFGRLHPSVQYLVREGLRFPGLRPVQAQTLAPVLDGDDVVVLAPTAGGKTEAAVLPVLSRILTEGLAAVSTLYICPLRALLNNQEPRLRRMAELVGLRVGKWHGDVPPRERKLILGEPPDLLLITPESLEVLLIRPGDEGRRLLSRIRIAIIDEVHAFAGDPRGAHLVSVLERLQERQGGHVQRIGLSATVGNPGALGRWLQGSGAAREPVVVAPGGDARRPLFRFGAVKASRGVARLVRDLGRGQKRLVFVESRSRAEELARALQGGGVAAWVHHSSVGRARRQEAELAFEGVRDAVLVATSSLELGIDIGDLDQIFQLDAPASVSSLAQRLGRTGRRPGTVPQMTFAAAGPEELLLAVALTELFQEGWIEDLAPSSRLWTVLVHQVFANLLELGGATRGRLLERLRFVPSFAGFEDCELGDLLSHLVSEGWLDEVDGALVLGQRAEKVFGARNFFKLYAVFDAPSTLSVRVGNEEVGTLQSWFAGQLTGAQRTFRLAGRSWEAIEVDLDHGVVRARPAAKGRVPSWTGRPSAYSRTVCERILDLLKSDRVPEGCAAEAVGWLEQTREATAGVPAVGTLRPLVAERGRVVWHTFAGARINLVLARLVEHETGWATSTSNLSVKVRAADIDSLLDAVVRVQEALAGGSEPPAEEWAAFDSSNRSLVMSAFQGCLPDAAEQEYLRWVFLDVEGARRWAREVVVG